jgi:hypothetical protein
LWNCMYSRKLPITSFRAVFGLLSQNFLPHIRAACKHNREPFTELLAPHQSCLQTQQRTKMIIATLVRNLACLYFIYITTLHVSAIRV